MSLPKAMLNMSNTTRKVTIQHSNKTKYFTVRDVDGWQAVADFLVPLMVHGSIVTLSGTLGAGKTTLVQYLAKKLGAPKRALSPTFALLRTYKLKATPNVGRGTRDVRRLLHLDAYRLESPRDILALDLDEELIEPGTAIVIEWPENISTWLKDKKIIDVKIDHI